MRFDDRPCNIIQDDHMGALALEASAGITNTLRRSAGTVISHVHCNPHTLRSRSPVLEALFLSRGDWVRHQTVQPQMVAKALERLALDLEQLKVDMNDPEIAWRIEQDLKDARGLHVAETPEFFVNGRALPTFSLKQLENLVNEAIKNSYH